MERVNWVYRALTFVAVLAVVLVSAYLLSAGGGSAPTPNTTQTAGQATGQAKGPAAAATTGQAAAGQNATPAAPARTPAAAAPANAPAATAPANATNAATPARGAAAPAATATAQAGDGFRAPLVAAPAVPPTTEPFFDQTVLMSQAFGFEMIARRIAILERYELTAALVVQLRKMPHVDYNRFQGTLRARDPQLADQFFSGLWQLIETATNGGDRAPALAKVRGMLATARDTVISPAFQRTPAYKSALAIDMLLAGDGVAEAFEEAFANPAEYANGWVALQRVKQIWADLEPMANDAAKAEGGDAIATLDALYASPTPPQPMTSTGRTPEDAEAAAQHLAGVIEQVVQLNLFPGRDLRRLTEHLVQLTGKACAAYDNGGDDQGQEMMYALGHHYGQQITGMLGLLDPNLNAALVELFDKLVSADDLMDEPPELITARKVQAARRAARQALQGGNAAAPANNGPILEADDDDAPQTEPGWLICPDIDALMQRALATVRG